MRTTQCTARLLDTTQPQVTCTENVAKFGRVVFEICEQTDRQTDRQADHNTLTIYQ